MKKLFEKLKSLPAGVKASVAFFLASVVTKGIAYIVTPIYTRILSPEVYGQTTIFTTWLEIFGIVAMFSLSAGVFNNGMVDHPEKRDEFSFSMLVLSNIITLFFSILLLSLYPFIQEFIGLDYAFIFLMCVVFLFQPAYNFWSARQRYELKYKASIFWTILSTIVSPATAIILILTTDGNDLYARIFGANIFTIIMYIGFYIFLAKKSKFKVNVKYWKDAILFNLPLIPHYLSTYLLGNTNKLLIQNIVGDAAVAYYGVAYSVAAVALVVWTAVNSTLIPHTYENCKTKNYSAINRVVMPILTVFAVVCVLVMLFAPEVVAIMATAEYMEAIYVIPPVVGGVFFQVHYYIYANVVYYYKKPKFVMIASITATVLNFVLGYFCITNFGYLAAGYVTLVCFLVQATIDYFAMRKAIKDKIYNMKYIGLLSLIVIVCALLCNFIYPYPILRYAIVLVIVILAIVFRKKIFEAIANLRKKPEKVEDKKEEEGAESIEKTDTVEEIPNETIEETPKENDEGDK